MPIKKKMIYSGMGEYADSYQGSGDVPNIRTVPRAPSRELLNQVHKFAAMRADEVYNPQPIKGGFVHRPKLYRGVGAGMSKDESDGYFEGGGDFFDGFNKALHLRPSQRLSEKKVKNAFDKTNKNIITPMATVTKYVAPLLGPYGLPVSAALGAVGYGSKSKSDGRMARAQIVKQVMNDRGISMIEASKIVKKEGLY